MVKPPVPPVVDGMALLPQDPAGAGDPGSVDLRQLDQMRAMPGGGSAFARDMVDLFVKESFQRVHQLGDAIDREDPAAAAQLAHGLRGSAATIGAIRLARLCEDIERLGAAGAACGLRERYSITLAELATAIETLRSATR